MYKLEKKRNSFLAIGFMFSLFMVLTAMEWKTEVETSPNYQIIKCWDIYCPPPPPPPVVPPAPRPPDIIICQGPAEIDGIELFKKGTFKVERVDTLVWEEEEEDFDYEDIPEPPLLWANVMPQFRNGEQDRIDYLMKRIKYPRSALEDGVSGKVWVKFIVSPKGELQQIEIERGIGGGCDEEVLRVVSKMPKWKPAQMMGRDVAVRMAMHVEFRIY